MKKVTKVVTLAATALCAFGVVGAISATLAKAPKAEAAAVQMYTIKVVCDSKITYECNKVIAKEGDRVDLTLSYNHRNYAVDSVSIGNDEYAAMIDDKTFYFAMPAKDVTVVVNSRALNEDTGLVDIINDNEEEGLFLNGCPAMAMPGDCVSFTVTMAADSPYRFTGYVEIYDGEEELIDFDENNGVFTFIVPETLKTFTETKQCFGKLKGRQYYHFTQSFPPNENITAEQAHEAALKFAEECRKFWGYEILVVTHKDKDHLHTHFVMNSVSFIDGQKFHMSRKELSAMKESQNQICTANNL